MPLFLLFTVEMWERFSYYGMRALLIFYLTKQWIDGGLALDPQSANLIYGLFTGLVYFTPLIGGWIADNYIGQRKSISIGAFLMMMGQFALASSQSFFALYLGLTLLILGNGFFKPNISVLVGQLYEHDRSKLDSAFTIFYMGINLGALFAPLVTGFLAMKYNYNVGFFSAGIGLLIGQIIYHSFSKKLLGDIGSKPKEKNNCKQTSTKENLTDKEKQHTAVIFIITFFVIFFFAGFEQAGSSFSLFTDEQVDRVVGGFEIPSAWFQSVNPLFIVLLAPLLSFLWKYLSGKDKEPSISAKMATGMILLGGGFVLMFFAAQSIEGSEWQKASLLWVVFAYLLHTIGELCLSPIGLSMVSQLSPPRLASLLMGVWFLSSFVANLLAGYVASLVSSVGPMDIFLMIALVSIVLGLILFALTPKLKKMME